MRFAFSTGSLYSYGLERAFALGVEAGFDGIEVLVDHRYDTRQAGYLRRLVERYGCPIVCLHAPFRPERLDTWGRTYPQSVTATAELATTVAAEVVVVHLPRRGQGAFARWLVQDLPAWQAAHPSPRIAIENMPLKWFRWWPLAPLDPWRLNRLQEWGNFPCLSLDTTHLATKGLDPLEIYERLREQVGHIHLSNARREGRRVREHLRLEDGSLALDVFLGRLARDGYRGIVTVELHPQSLEAADEEKVRQHLREQVAFCRRYGRGA